jgi:membrane protease subunit HflC
LPIVIVARSAVFVDETEAVLVTDFGKPVALHGKQPGDTGLRWRLPWQGITRIDRRLHVFDAPTREMITEDKRNFEVASYVAWRVADPERFLEAAGTSDAAEARLGERVAAALSDTIGRHPSTALASIDVRQWSLDALTNEVEQAVARSSKEELGIEVVQVRLRRFVPPVEVRPAIFDLIRGERKQVAASLRAEGEAAYSGIVAKADRDRDLILAKAEADAERIKGQGDAEATRILNEAHARDPKFYEFLKTLETYRALIDEKTTVVLSSASPLLRLLTQGPGEPPVKESPRSNSGGKP